MVLPFISIFTEIYFQVLSFLVVYCTPLVFVRQQVKADCCAVFAQVLYSSLSLLLWLKFSLQKAPFLRISAEMLQMITQRPV